jgi:hypothetical protein
VASREEVLAGTRSGRCRAAKMNRAVSMAKASTAEGDQAGASTERRVGRFHGGHGRVEDEFEGHTQGRARRAESSAVGRAGGRATPASLQRQGVGSGWAKSELELAAQEQGAGQGKIQGRGPSRARTSGAASRLRLYARWAEPSWKLEAGWGREERAGMVGLGTRERTGRSSTARTPGRAGTARWAELDWTRRTGRARTLARGGALSRGS